jgi:chitinase
MSASKALLCACLILVLVHSVTIDRIVRPVNKRKASNSATIRLIYINQITDYYGAAVVPRALGVPGFTDGNVYNYVAHTFWTYPNAPLQASLIWSQLFDHMRGDTRFGFSTSEVQATLKANFSNNGARLLVSAFGATQAPTSSNFNATDCGLQLAKFVNDNMYDGVDIDWEDTKSFSSGDSSGENWLITLTTVLRNNLHAGAIITHAPQAPYFGVGLYPKGAYLTVEKTVGAYIDFYNVQFYNQGKGLYETAQNLFNASTGWCPGTSVNEIIAAGVPASKIVLGKPAIKQDAHSGYMDAATLNAAIVANFPYNGWNTGLMYWQYVDDLDGAICNAAGKGVITTFQEE